MLMTVTKTYDNLYPKPTRRFTYIFPYAAYKPSNGISQKMTITVAAHIMKTLRNKSISESVKFVKKESIKKYITIANIRMSISIIR